MTHAGVYLHIPFCRSRCSYCDFATGMFESGLADRYVNALVKEIAEWSEVDAPTPVDTIFFGGGTPSLLTPSQIERILKAVQGRFEMIDGAEVTLELNPGDGGESPLARRETMREFRRVGINRASFGAQSFDDRELKQLGRTHLSADIAATLEHLRAAGFDNISFDLIAGLPGQTLSGWQKNLDEALNLRPDHLSLYLLDVHEGTPLAEQIRSGMRPMPDDDLAGEMYQLMLDEVTAAGYQHYEISNFCLPGFESRHNTKYWAGAPYYGFGCSAHSFDGGRRRWANERDMSRYADLIEQEKTPIVERTELNEDEVRSESIFLGLRLMRGLDLADYRNRFGSDLLDRYDADIDRLVDAGLIIVDEGLMRLTRRGALLSNEVMSTFV
jgi:oxygen-independent coproporphyrinogen-3 oxidase